MSKCLQDSEKIILDLCGGTGAWSRPYKEAGYDVRLVTLPEYDVRYYQPPKHVYGILAAPPCTDFCISGVRWWVEKDRTRGLLLALSVVAARLRIIDQCKPQFWALENPVGRLPRYIGKYEYTFQPYEYGDPWTKRTCIWGKHNPPIKAPVTPVGKWVGGSASGHEGIVDNPHFLPPDWIHKLPPGANRSELRSITPSGFARAFFEANR